MAMLILLKTQLHDLAMSVSDHTISPNGGGPRIDRWSALSGKFWVLDNTADRKDLHKRYGCESGAHRLGSLKTTLSIARHRR